MNFLALNNYYFNQNKTIHGTFTSIFDFHKYFESTSEHIFLSDQRSIEIVQEKDRRNNWNLKNLLLEQNISYKNVITSASTIFNIFKKQNYSLESENLILLDSTRLFAASFYYSNFTDILNFLKDKSLLKYKNLLILTNTFQYYHNNSIKSLNKEIYFQKVFKERIKNLYTRDTSYNILNKPHCVVKTPLGDLRYENIGKSVLETLICGYKVDYTPNSYKDGLCHYLEYAGLKNSLNKQIIEPENIDIQKFLFGSEDEKIVEKFFK